MSMVAAVAKDRLEEAGVILNKIRKGELTSTPIQLTFGMYQEASRQRDEAVEALVGLTVMLDAVAAYAECIAPTTRGSFALVTKPTGERITIEDVRGLAYAAHLVTSRYADRVRTRRKSTNR